MKKINKIFTAFVTLVSVSSMMISCKKDFLGVAEQLAPEINIDSVFKTPNLTRSFYANIFTGMPNSSNIIFNPNYNIGAFDNPWAGMTDELKIAQGALRDYSINGYNADNAQFQRWTTCYRLIRQANLFLENAHEIPKAGDADYIDATEINKMKAVARFFRAYYHYLLFEQYGPIPIMNYAENPDNKVLSYSRSSVDEVVSFIEKELTAVIPELDDVAPRPEERSVPTKAVALAVKAKLMVYAASPLYNGGYSSALQLRNIDGKQLFPQADPTKWNKALNAVEEFINFANGKYTLFKKFNPDGTYNPDWSLYELFINVDENKEVIWASPVSSWGNIGQDGTERRIMPRTERGGFASIGVLQELVDAFFMNDGLSIKESPLYKETGFSSVGDDNTGRTEPGTFNMYVHREPRFYQTVFFQDRKWHISNNKVQFHAGSGNDRSNPNNPYTGYLLYKRAAKNVYNQGTYPRTQYRPSIIFRLADFYLLYAEVLNEVNPNDDKILHYIDLVRERAGIPKLADIKPGIKGNKSAQREAIIAERRVELCTEGQRYFDVRRWMIAGRSDAQGGGRQGGDFHGMNMYSKELTTDGYFKRTTIETRTFTENMYLYPIPLSEIQKSVGGLLVQNPGW